MHTVFVRMIILNSEFLSFFQNKDDDPPAANTDSVQEDVDTNALKSDGGAAKNQVIEVKSIDSLIRYALMVFIGFVTTFIVLINGVIQVTNGGVHQYRLADLVLPLDAMINMLCIYLLFGFGEKLYYKLCICCDGCLKNCFVNRILSKRGSADDDELNVQQSKNLLFQTI